MSECQHVWLFFYPKGRYCNTCCLSEPEYDTRVERAAENAKMREAMFERIDKMIADRVYSEHFKGK